MTDVKDSTLSTTCVFYHWKRNVAFVKMNKTLLFGNDCLQITLGYKCGYHDRQNTGGVTALTFTKGAQAGKTPKDLTES